MKLNRTLGLLLVATATVGAGAAVAAVSTTTTPTATTTATAPAPGGKHWHRGHHGGGMLVGVMLRATRQLNLTTEQQASIKSIMTNAGPQMKSIHQEMRANSLKLQNTQPNDPNYANVVAEVTAANGSLHSQMISQQAELRAQVFKILTPAQQTQLAALEAAQ